MSCEWAKMMSRWAEMLGESILPPAGVVVDWRCGVQLSLMKTTNLVTSCLCSPSLRRLIWGYCLYTRMSAVQSCVQCGPLPGTVPLPVTADVSGDDTWTDGHRPQDFTTHQICTRMLFVWAQLGSGLSGKPLPNSETPPHPMMAGKVWWQCQVSWCRPYPGLSRGGGGGGCLLIRSVSQCVGHVA